MTTFAKLRQLLKQSIGQVAPSRLPFSLTVQKTEQLSPNMQRVTLGGKAVASFPNVAPGSYLKLLFDHQGQPLQVLPQDGVRPLMRTYTIRHIDKKMKMVTLDMVLHSVDDCGPASRWAGRVKVGETILLQGPGSIKPLPGGFDWVLFAGDMTALPAIAGYLEALPGTARGYAVIQVVDLGDVQPLKKPPNVKVQWVVGEGSEMMQRIRDLQWLKGKPAVWVACEFSLMRQLRQEFRVHRQVDHEQMYISSYWRIGRSEEQHKEDKQRDQRAFNTQPSM
ncbi:siderophore-interacting protein [Alteromonas aestuariivivens]|uniref:Siderophore-interacting protein n=1 Tax=Alteromonas aestuariivivens TaxID=1938339 RepID=A0A3D8MAM9_9ALTE|nr:siderophore-interacting protein [Alteromonas aestuariivivens]RDV26785.1 siderophore-interacting protein [Alteromonas aestuariivivens]